MANKNSRQLFSLAFILGMWSPFVNAGDIIKIDENAYQEMIDKKNKEGEILDSRYISQKTPIISEDLMEKLKEMPRMGRQTINVIVTLKTNDIDIKAFKSVGQVSIDDNGDKKALLNGEEVDLEVFEQENQKILEYQKKVLELKQQEIKKSLKKFAESYNFLEKRVASEVLENEKDNFEIRLSKFEIMKIAQNSDLILGIELPMSPKDLLSNAMLSTRVDPYAFYGNQGNTVDIYMSESGCPNSGFITNYSKIAGSRTNHSETTSSIMRGVSPDSFLYCRGGFTLPHSSDTSVEIQNHSWGAGGNNDYRTTDRDFDNYVISNNDLIFVAAGNSGRTAPGNVGSPAKGLNVISVGSYNDEDDKISNFSSYGDPQTKNQKPELVAPGETITAGGHNNTNGTSFASPHAAAFAADLMSNYTWMKHKPHLGKAWMLAGATKNISGGADKVGVGGIDFWSANYNGQMKWWTNVSYDYYKSHDDGSNNSVLEWKIGNNLTKGKKYRAVISWLNRGDYIYSHRNDSHPIGKDFDMTVYDPNGNYVCGSSSWDNPYEICNFTANVTGKYMIRINRYDNRDTGYNMSLAAVINQY